MTCVNCDSERIVSLVIAGVENCKGSIGDLDFSGYIPPDIGIGDVDELNINYCLDCGQLQEDFPLPITELEEENEHF